MNKIKNKTLVPYPGNFIWVCPEDSWKIESHAFNVLESRAKEYRRINNYPIGSHWSEDFEEQVCKNHPEGTCYKYEPPSLGEMATQATRELIRWAKSGMKVRSEQRINEILEICKGCEYFSGSKRIFRVACGKCGCGGLKLSLVSTHCPAGKWK